MSSLNDLIAITDLDGLPLPAEAVPFTVIGQGAVIVQPRGTIRRYGLDLVDPASGSNRVGEFADSTATRAFVWAGDSSGALATLATTWAQAADGQLFLDVLPANLEPLELQPYPLRVETLTGGAFSPAWSGWLVVVDEPGAALGPAPRVYCGYRDLTRLGGKAIDQLRSLDEGAGFLASRLEAREWMDEVILARYRPAGLGAGGFCLGTGPALGADSPSSWLKGKLDAGGLILTDAAVRLAATKSLAFLWGRQADASYQRRSAAAHRNADSGAAGLVAQIDTNADGIADLAINCGVFSTRSL